MCPVDGREPLIRPVERTTARGMLVNLKQAGERRRRAMTDPTVRVRRVYDEPQDDDGARILVDRLWPRGVSKERTHLDDWCKEVAPSTELRQWYNHDPALFDEFAVRYR